MLLDETSLNLLKKTKLNDKQARVYLAVLQLGKATASQIAELAQLKRPLTYVILDELVQQSYVTHIPEERTKRYTAIDPNMIAHELEHTAHDFKEMLPYLRSMQRKAGKPYVTYYHGVDGAQKAFQQIRRPREARYAISIHKALARVPQEVERWKKTYLQGKARPGGRHLLTDTNEDRAYGQAISQAEQIVRYLSKGNDLDMDLALIDGAVYLTAFEDDIHVTVIESGALYRSLCALYDLAWAEAKK
jgi:HTH-type transcriptional regulator, sugar sensing transcriptional regulator